MSMLMVPFFLLRDHLRVGFKRLMTCFCTFLFLCWFFGSVLQPSLLYMCCLLRILETISLFSFLLLFLSSYRSSFLYLTIGEISFIALRSALSSPCLVLYLPYTFSTLYPVSPCLKPFAKTPVLYFFTVHYCNRVIKPEWLHAKINKSKSHQPQPAGQLEKLLLQLNQM